MSKTQNITKSYIDAWEKASLLLPLFLLYALSEFGWQTITPFYSMARWSEPFSLFTIMVDTWEYYFFFSSLLQSMVSDSFWQYKICLVLSLLFWWRKPTKWRSALLVFFAFLSYLYLYALTMEWYGEALEEYSAYRQMLPTWFPPTPGRLFSAFINLF